MIPAIATAALLLAAPLAAQSPATASMPGSPAYADLADLADSAPLVVRAEVRKLAPVDAARARGVRSGHGRYYVEARTQALIAGNASLSEALSYLVDLPLDAKGKPPALKKKSVVVFARAVPGRAGELQLVAPDAQVLWEPTMDARLRAVLTELLGAGAPPRVTGVREAIYVPGNLAGEGETQIFLNTAKGDPAAITVLHQPGQPPSWNASFSELLDDSGRPPQPETLAWYRLACFLPAALSASANVSSTPEDRALAESDYRLVKDRLGSCGRTRR
ncbi:MAG TPA: hypothetical protein VHG29_01355 [Novosphingobium sp.]|nr:hypothetical protein [Novosphingobium sp.]